MNRIDRLTAIITYMQGRNYTTAAVIAERYSISIRTVYRDLRALDESGVPIGFEPAKGYFITAGYFLPPVMFNEEEALAMISVGKMLATGREISIQRRFTSALEKIKSVLPVAYKENISLLEDKIRTISVPDCIAGQPNHFLITAEKAIVRSHCLKITYKALSQEYSQRLISPLGIYYHFESWYLLAYCNLRKAMRDFRFDRIVSMTESEQTFIPPAQFSLPEYLEKRRQDEPKIAIEAVMSKADFDSIAGMKYINAHVKSIEKDGSVLVSFLVGNPEPFTKWLLFYCDSSRIVAPDAMLIVQEKLLEKINNKLSAILT